MSDSRHRIAAPTPFRQGLLRAALAALALAPAVPASAGWGKDSRALFYGDIVGGYLSGSVKEWHVFRIGGIDSWSRLGFTTHLVAGHYGSRWDMDSTVTTSALFGGTSVTRQRNDVSLITFLPMQFHFTPFVWRVHENVLGAVNLFYSFNRWAIPQGQPGPGGASSVRFNSGYDEYGVQLLLPLIGMRFSGYRASVPGYTIQDGIDPEVLYSHQGFDDTGAIFAFDLYFGGLVAASPDKAHLGFVPWLAKPFKR